MNNNIVPFNNAALGCSVRTVIINEEPWFVGKDVCSALGYANETDAMNRHCKGVVKRYPPSNFRWSTGDSRYQRTGHDAFNLRFQAGISKAIRGMGF